MYSTWFLFEYLFLSKIFLGSSSISLLQSELLSLIREFPFYPLSPLPPSLTGLWSSHDLKIYNSRKPNPASVPWLSLITMMMAEACWGCITESLQYTLSLYFLNVFVILWWKGHGPNPLCMSKIYTVKEDYWDLKVRWESKWVNSGDVDQSGGK